MDQYLSTVIIAVITGLFSVITIIIQKKQDKVINKIDEQTMFIEKEKDIKQKLNKCEKEREAIIHDMLILILETNLYIVNTIDHLTIDETVFTQSDELKEKFQKISKDIEELNKEYNIVLDMTKEFNNEMSKRNKK